MSQTKLTHATAFSSQLTECTLDDVKYDGTIPEWLSGSFVSNGPAQFEVGDTHFKHWLDGFAMLKKFTFKNQKVSFQNRFLRSEQYVNSNANKKLYVNEFATYTDTSWIMRVIHSLKSIAKGEIYDNCNVSVGRLGDTLVAMTESNQILPFDISNLESHTAFQFSDSIPFSMNLAHPQWDTDRRELINIATEIGKDIKYHIYKVTPGSRHREVIKTYTSDKLFYMHSFSITKNYIILHKSPLIINKFALMFSLPFKDTLSWKINDKSFFIIIDRRDGSVTEIETDSFLCLHSVNAFEKRQEIVLDLICHTDINPYDTLYLSNLCSDNPKYNPISLQRYVVDPYNKKFTNSNVITNLVEFPNINYSSYNGRQYQFCYVALITDKMQAFFNAIQKIDMNTGNNSGWNKAGYYVGEPLFISKPNASTEDDGIILFIAFCVQTQCSSLIILDAKTMQQIAEIFLPFHLPIGLHGNFYKN